MEWMIHASRALQPGTFWRDREHQLNKAMISAGQLPGLRPTEIVHDLAQIQGIFWHDKDRAEKLLKGLLDRESKEPGRSLEPPGQSQDGTVEAQKAKALRLISHMHPGAASELDLLAEAAEQLACDPTDPTEVTSDSQTDSAAGLFIHPPQRQRSEPHASASASAKEADLLVLPEGWSFQKSTKRTRNGVLRYSGHLTSPSGKTFGSLKEAQSSEAGLQQATSKEPEECSANPTGPHSGAASYRRRHSSGSDLRSIQTTSPRNTILNRSLFKTASDANAVLQRSPGTSVGDAGLISPSALVRGPGLPGLEKDQALSSWQLLGTAQRRLGRAISDPQVLIKELARSQKRLQTIDEEPAQELQAPQPGNPIYAYQPDKPLSRAISDPKKMSQVVNPAGYIPAGQTTVAWQGVVRYTAGEKLQVDLFRICGALPSRIACILPSTLFLSSFRVTTSITMAEVLDKPLVFHLNQASSEQHRAVQQMSQQHLAVIIPLANCNLALTPHSNARNPLHFVGLLTAHRRGALHEDPHLQGEGAFVGAYNAEPLHKQCSTAIKPETSLDL